MSKEFKRYLCLYDDGLPKSRIVLSGTPPSTSWVYLGQGFKVSGRRCPRANCWFIDLDAQPLPTMFRPTTGSFDPSLNINPQHWQVASTQWAGRLPPQWLNSRGDLCNSDGKIVFTYNPVSP